MHALQYEALEAEKGGVLVYETALRCAINENLSAEWEKYLEQTRHHVEVLITVLAALGLNPDQERPGRTVVRHSAFSLIETMEIALVAGKPEAPQIVAAECVVQAETKDHLNWELIGMAADALSGEEQAALKNAYEEVEDEEDEHRYHSAGWARELHLDVLGLPAELPPPEEEQDVKSEAEAGAVKNARKKAAPASKKGKKND